MDVKQQQQANRESARHGALILSHKDAQEVTKLFESSAHICG
jgi:hypothetical protein